MTKLELFRLSEYLVEIWLTGNDISRSKESAILFSVSANVEWWGYIGS